MRPYELYGAREGSSLVHLVLSWPRTHGNVILCRGHKMLICGNVILTRGNLMLCRGHTIVFVEVTTSFQDDMLKELHIFLMAMSLMCKQTYTTIATRDY